MEDKGGGSPSPMFNINDSGISDITPNDSSNIGYIEISHNESNTVMEQDTEVRVLTGNKKKVLVKYSYRCKGPFEVYLESNLENKNIGNSHNLALAKFVYDLGINDVQKILKKGKNRISVCFKNYLSANKFLEQLENDGRYNVFIPNNRVTCKGIIKQVDLDFDTNLIKKYISSNINEIDILDVRRLKRRKMLDNNTSEYVDTGTICITFSGTSLPREISICGLIYAVTPYILPVVQCFKCLLFGHTQKLCKGKEKCQNCSILLEKHNKEMCLKKCMHCNSSFHNSLDRSCPEFLRQKNIKELMSLENKTFFEASECIPKLSHQVKKFPSPNFRANDFPSLKLKENNILTTEINERRNVYKNANPAPLYSQISQTPKRRKQSGSPSRNSPNQTEINKCLISPNGRSPQSFLSSSPMLSRTNLNNTHSTPQEEREALQAKCLEDIRKVASFLSLNDKVQVLNFMTQLKGISCNIVSDEYNSQSE